MINIFAPVRTFLGSSALVCVIKLQQQDRGDTNTELSGWRAPSPWKGIHCSQESSFPEPLAGPGADLLLAGWW